jgi:hypothetical protein
MVKIPYGRGGKLIFLNFRSPTPEVQYENSFLFPAYFQFEFLTAVSMELFHILDGLLDIISVFRVCCGSFSEGRGSEGHHQLGMLWNRNRNRNRRNRNILTSGTVTCYKKSEPDP